MQMEPSHRLKAHPKRIIAVDLDGTLAYYDKWVAWDQIGDPIPAMVERVNHWLAEGHEVRIFTARVARERDICYKTKHRFTAYDMRQVIRNWCVTHTDLRSPFQITAIKDNDITEFWDDRAVQIIPNTGFTLSDEHAAAASAALGKTFVSNKAFK